LQIGKKVDGDWEELGDVVFVARVAKDLAEAPPTPTDNSFLFLAPPPPGAPRMRGGPLDFVIGSDELDKEKAAAIIFAVYNIDPRLDYQVQYRCAPLPRSAAASCAAAHCCTGF
jgi:hypothetical protein